MNGLKRLAVVRNLSQTKPNWRHTDLFRILHKEDLWIAAYENIKGNKGALTPGVTSATLDGMSLERLRKVQKRVLEESYQFTPVKQILIPKANGKTRPLGLPSADDKLVQEVIRMILEAIYEPIFVPESFGFRACVGVHDALAHVEDRFRWVDWVVKGDIQNAYPTIDHGILRSLLSRNIDDPRFLRLINKSLKADIYTNPNTMYSKIGVPQGSVVSPILANVYFHNLDEFIAQKRKEWTLTSKRNPAYRSLEAKIGKLNTTIEHYALDSKERKELSKEIKQLIRQRDQTPSLVYKGARIEYARYADDWIVGVKSPRSVARQLKEEIAEFMETSLHQVLDPVKTEVINLRARKVLFLGYEIFLPRHMKKVAYKKPGGKQTSRRSSPTLRFHVPVKQMVQRMKERGYVAFENQKVRPVSKRSYSPLEDEAIVSHFKSVWLGLLNFYSGASNRTHLQYLHYLLHMSCAMTLAHRHRSTSKKIFKKHKKRLEIRKKDSDKVVAYFPYKTTWKVGERRWQRARGFKDPFEIYANRVSKSRLRKICLVCQATETIEMHHVKHVRKKGYRYRGFQAEMALLNRKQIPLCQNCHRAVHRGEYDGIRLSIVEDGKT